MKNLFYKLAACITIACVLLSSCENKTREGTLQLGSTLPALKSVSNEPAVTSAVVTISDENGSKVYENYKVEIMNMNGYYISKPLSLKEGSYKLCSFALADNNNNMLYATPVAGSSKAYLVQKPLSCGFTISKDDVTKLEPEVISTASCVPQDFGYATFSYSIVKTFDFYLGVFIYDELIKNFKLTDAVFTASAPDKTIVSMNLSNATQRISMPSGIASYSISVSKPGYKTYTKTFAEEELAAYNGTVDSTVLKIILEKSSISDGLVAYYPFNGNTNDESGKGNHAKAYGVSLTSDRTGKENSAYYFDGKTNYISAPNSTSLQINGQLTMCAWIKTNNANAYSGIINKIKPTSPCTGYGMCIYGQNQVLGKIYWDHSQSIGVAIYSTTQINDNKWHFISFTYDGAAVKLYIDNELTASQSYSKGIQTNTEPLLIGYDVNNYLGDRHYQGEIDEVRIYSRALAESEIKELFNTAD